MSKIYLFFLIGAASLLNAGDPDNPNLSIDQTHVVPASSQQVLAQAVSTPEPGENKNLQTSSKIPLPYLVLRAGYFFFSSPTMRDVYHHGGIDVQLSSAYPVYSYLSVYSSIEYLKKSGQSLNGEQHTSIWEVPLSLGLQAMLPLNKIKYYASVGPRYFFARAHNDSSFVPRVMNANNLGGFINTGCLWAPFPYLNLDFFAEYSYVRLHFHSSHPASQGHTVQAGGITLGGGLAYIF